MSDVLTDAMGALGGAVVLAEGPVTMLADAAQDVAMQAARPRRKLLLIFVLIGLGVGVALVMKRRREAGESQPLG